MKRITLNGINRVGLAAWKAREWWAKKAVMIWSREHAAWWRPSGMGYTDDVSQAGVFDFDDAWARTKHCGPEKRIEYVAVT